MVNFFNECYNTHEYFNAFPNHCSEIYSDAESQADYILCHLCVCYIVTLLIFLSPLLLIVFLCFITLDIMIYFNFDIETSIVSP